MEVMVDDGHLTANRNIQHLRLNFSYIVEKLRITLIHLNQEVMS